MVLMLYRSINSKPDTLLSCRFVIHEEEMHLCITRCYRPVILQKLCTGLCTSFAQTRTAVNMTEKLPPFEEIAVWHFIFTIILSLILLMFYGLISSTQQIKLYFQTYFQTF